jgi:peptidyl-prolyl cis-trans isomerase C
MTERLFTKIRITDQEITEYFKNHQNEFKLPERVEIRQILLGDESDAKKVRAQTTAHNFAEMARQHSLSAEAERGGLLGPFPKGGMPAVFEYAFHMHKGQVSEILKSNYGYHIIMLLEKYPKKDLSLDEARPRIIALLKKKHEEQEYRKWVDRALAAISVTSPKPAW